MEGVGKCIGVWGEVRGGVLEVWEVCWGVAKCVWDVGKGCWGGVKVGGARKCGKKYGTIWESEKLWGEG